jgi:GDP-4-dehydro-6-deoxy-D-mannose reductase
MHSVRVMSSDSSQPEHPGSFGAVHNGPVARNVDRAFITGGNGFVGTYLQAHLRMFGDEIAAPFVEITDRASLSEELQRFRPTTIYHLAGQANVGLSWQDSAGTFTTNALGTLQLVEAAAALEQKPTVIVVSSAEVYGVVEAHEGPVSELRKTEPTTPYGSSKLAAEAVALQIGRANDMAVIVTIGPGQSPSFVVSGVASRIAEAERDGRDFITIGNLESVRDFTDVRDVVTAYRLLGQFGEAGSIYNIGSGTGRTIKELVDVLIGLSSRPIELRADPAFMRPSDIPRLVCDATRIRSHTTWSPSLSVEDSLAATLDWWRAKVAG